LRYMPDNRYRVGWEGLLREEPRSGVGVCCLPPRGFFYVRWCGLCFYLGDVMQAMDLAGLYVYVYFLERGV